MPAVDSERELPIRESPQAGLVNGLAARQLVEREWHNQHPELGEVEHVNPYKAIVLERLRHRQWELRGDLSGKRVLEIGCGVGQETVELARRGAQVVAIDISPTLVSVATRRVIDAGLAEMVEVEVCAAEDLWSKHYKPFDVVVGNGVLHHLDLPLFKQALSTLMARGSFAQFQEPLIHNPLLRAYRWLTPHLRTETERPLSAGDVAEFVAGFGHIRLEYHNLVGLLSFPAFYLLGSRLTRVMLRRLVEVDKALVARWPSLGMYSQYVLIQVTP